MFPISFIVDRGFIQYIDDGRDFNADFEIIEMLLHYSKYLSCQKTVDILTENKNVSKDFCKQLAIAIYYDQFIRPDEVIIIVSTTEEYDIANHYFGEDMIRLCA